MARPPTEAQVKFAEAIADELCVELPAVRTRQTMFLFIRDNKPNYDRRMRLRRKWENPDPDLIDPDEDWYHMTGEGLDPATGGFDDNYCKEARNDVARVQMQSQGDDIADVKRGGADHVHTRRQEN